MENKGVICDVEKCIHNIGCAKCSLPQIKVTENCGTCAPGVETPHFCQSYQSK